MSHFARFSVAIPYLGMVFAVVLGTWTFLQADSLREQTAVVWQENASFQWRGSQARERLAKVQGLLLLANETGKVRRDFGRQAALLASNITQMLQLPHHRRILTNDQIVRLRRARQMVKAYLVPISSGTENHSEALFYASEIEKVMLDVTSATVKYASLVEETAQISMVALRNWFAFWIALTLAVLFYLLINERFKFVRQRDQNQHFRSFASLFSHATKSNIAGLKLFLAGMRRSFTCSPEMLTAAIGAVDQLETTHQTMGIIAYPTRDTRLEPVGVLLQDIVSKQGAGIVLRVDPEAAHLPLPSAQLCLTINELIQNAERATSGDISREIVVGASVKRWGLVGGKCLVIEVRDNGVGMSPEVKKGRFQAVFHDQIRRPWRSWTNRMR